jgi:hypothetical protein
VVALLLTLSLLGSPEATDKHSATGVASAADAHGGSGADAHWAFQPLRRVAPPHLAHTRWALSDVDAFIQVRLEAKGLTPNPPADRRQLMRRLFFDLIGLAPPRGEVEAFIADPAPDAYERLVDRLLANPHLGERWARHWLDVARFAESHGYESDTERPEAWTYRDVVIRAMNDNLPFDSFVRLQLAGDLFAPDRPFAVALTGFLTAGPTVTNVDEIDREKARYEKVDDLVSATGAAFLALTVGCARCHDHKYDPITLRDYYRMAGFFMSGEERKTYLPWGGSIGEGTARATAAKKATASAQKAHAEWFGAQKERVYQELVYRKIDSLDVSPEEKTLLKADPEDDDKRAREIRKRYRKKIRVEDSDVRKTFSREEKEREEELHEEIRRLEAVEKRVSPPLGLTWGGGGRKQNPLLNRGDTADKGADVGVGVLTVLGPPAGELETGAADSPSGERVALARWMTDVEQGAGALLARVIVNRLWQHHFGVGLVSTSNNFGALGELPTHPELLDWLAGELIRSGWQLKHLHKLIVTSAVYKQDTTWDNERGALDPQNRLFWRRRPLRLEAEILRDAILNSAGTLNRSQRGPSVKPWISPDAIATGSTAKWPTDVEDGPATWRRSVYIFTRRSMRVPFLEVFDAPDVMASIGRRDETTVAPQALFVLNNPFVRAQAEHFARRVRLIAREDSRAAVAWVYWLALSRPPSDDELRLSFEFLTADRVGNEDGLVDLCHAIWTLNEFIYVD